MDVLVSAPAGHAPLRPRSARLLRAASDERLVALARAGASAAFEALYDRHHRQLLSFCRHMLGSREEAEDAVQHTFLSAHGALLRSDRPIQVRPWLYAIARNRCLSMLRARREGPGGDAAEPATTGLAEQVQQREDLRELLADVHALPEDQRAALVLAELGALGHEEIAEVLGVARPKVKALVFQARESLIASRQARQADCGEIREQLATLTGGGLRRAPLRRHLAVCDGCRAYKAEVARQRKALAILLPVVPSAALKHAALPAGLTGGGALAGGAASKLAVAAAVAVTATGGSVEVIRHEAPAKAAPAASSRPAAAPAVHKATHPPVVVARPHPVVHLARPAAHAASRHHTPAAPRHPAAASRPASPGRSATAPSRTGATPSHANPTPGVPRGKAVGRTRGAAAPGQGRAGGAAPPGQARAGGAQPPGQSRAGGAQPPGQARAGDAQPPGHARAGAAPATAVMPPGQAPARPAAAAPGSPTSAPVRGRP